MDRGATPCTRDLRDLALSALRDQGITTRRLRWMGQRASHTFRCDTADGERLLIRVCLPGVRTDAELDAELIWLAALARDTRAVLPDEPGWSRTRWWLTAR
jgi:Ser/Thr protein kinase RdoA (MazF antagonist)